MKIAFIHDEKKIGTGAHYINDLMSTKLRSKGIEVKNFYPKLKLKNSPAHLRGLANILYFYSLLEHKAEILRNSIIQGTTYTPLPFMAFSTPIVSHFGSTTRGFLKATPRANAIDSDTRKIWYDLRTHNVISELNIKTRRPMRDIAEIEKYVANRVNGVIATSENVKKELLEMGIASHKISIIHNAIENYWFEQPYPPEITKNPSLVFLGRLGRDAFTLKLKGFDRLIHYFKQFPNTQKTTVCISNNKKILQWMRTSVENHTLYANVKKDNIPNILAPLRGSILFIPSRYEGFSLSLVEGMSQSLIPIIYPVGVAEEIIQNGVNGYIVRSQKEAVEITNTILQDDDLRLKLSLAARNTSINFTSDALVEKLVLLYKKILWEIG